MKFIALGNKTCFLSDFDGTEEETKEMLKDWLDYAQGITGRDLEVYTVLYRDYLEIPDEVTAEEEQGFIEEKYGKTPPENDDFVTRMRRVNEIFEGRREGPANYFDWARERDVPAEEIRFLVQIP